MQYKTSSENTILRQCHDAILGIYRQKDSILDQEVRKTEQ